MSAIDLDDFTLPDEDSTADPLNLCTRLATNAVLLALACSDHELDQAEAAAIVTFCATAFNLSESQREDLLATARHLIEEPGSVVEACRLLREDMSTGQREAIATQLGTVMQADGKVTGAEQQMYRRIVAQLELVPRPRDRA